MKKFTVSSFIFLALCTFITSCTDFEDGGKYNDFSYYNNPDNVKDPETNNNTGDENNNENPKGESGVFKATVGGQTFVATTIQAIVNDRIAISGIRTDTGELIQITVQNNKVGTYVITDDGFDKNKLMIAYAKTNEWAYIGVSNIEAKQYGYTEYSDNAILKITEIDTEKKTISGTFQFTGIRVDGIKKTMAITNGSFTNISYSQDAPVVQPDNKLSAKLDGEDFVTTNVTAHVSMNNIIIYGNRGSVETIGILLPTDINEGTYTLGTMDTNYTIRYIKDMSPDSMFDAKKGSTVTILKHDKVKKTISGIFSATEITYTTSEKHEITEGSFNVSY